MRGQMMAAVALLAVAACGSKDEADVAKADGREVLSQTVTDDSGKTSEVTVRETDDGGANMTVRSEDGTAVLNTAGGDSAARYLPDWLPAYPGAEVTGGMQGASAEGSGSLVTLTTKDGPEKVIAFYEAAADKAGFKTVSRVEMGGMRMFSATKGSEGKGPGFQVQTSPADGGGTQVSLMISSS